MISPKMHLRAVNMQLLAVDGDDRHSEVLRVGLVNLPNVRGDLVVLFAATFIVTLYTKQRSSVIYKKDTIITNLDTLAITSRLICIAIADVQATKAVARSGKAKHICIDC